MKTKFAAAVLAVFCMGCLLSACSEGDPETPPDAKIFYADQQYYPTGDGTRWSYRIDTISAANQTTKDVSRKYCWIVGPRDIDTTGGTVRYVLQVNDVKTGTSTTRDSLYIRKNSGGVYVSSPQLLLLAQIPLLAQFGISFPKEFLILPQYVQPGLSWSILNLEFNQIPLYPIWFRVNATYLAKETLKLDSMTVKDCAKIKLDIDARFPNIQDQNPLNPLLIKESATFWLSRPFGLVAGDGSEAVFLMLSGQLPLTTVSRHVRHELTHLELPMSAGDCPDQ
jgi:hypothetical protein